MYGILVAEPASTATDRRYSIPAAIAEVMTAKHSLAYLGPLPRILVAAASRMPELLAAYRTGGNPNAHLDGYDVDAPSIEMARRNAAEAGLADRVSFHHAGGEELTGAYDAVFAFECVHDMPRPVEVLAAVRRAVRPDGAVIIMDEAVADEFTAPGDELEHLMYGFSLFICLPDGMSSPPRWERGP